MSDNLRSKVIRLAHANPALRSHLLPLLTLGGDKRATVNKTADKIYITEVAFGIWVRGDSRSKSIVQDRLNGLVDSVVTRLHERNQPRRPEPVAPARGRGKKPVPVAPPVDPGPHEIIPITVERVWEEARKNLAEAELIRDLDAGGFHQWFDDHLGDAMASLGHITVGIARSYPTTKGNTLVWEGKWVGAEQDDETEVAADTVEDDIEKVVTRLHGKSGHIPTRIEYLRNVGWQGNGEGNYSVYPMTAIFPVDPLKFLETVFTKAALPSMVADMVAKATAGLE